MFLSFWFRFSARLPVWKGLHWTRFGISSSFSVLFDAFVQRRYQVWCPHEFCVLHGWNLLEWWCNKLINLAAKQTARVDGGEQLAYWCFRSWRQHWLQECFHQTYGHEIWLSIRCLIGLSVCFLIWLTYVTIYKMIMLLMCWCLWCLCYGSLVHWACWHSSLAFGFICATNRGANKRKSKRYWLDWTAAATSTSI